MATFTNSFAIDVPPIEATIYTIDPQPENTDPWTTLNHYETELENEIGGSVHRYSRKGEWYLAAIGRENRIAEHRTPEGTALAEYATLTIDESRDRDQEVVCQELRESLGGYLTRVRDFWRFRLTSQYYRTGHSQIIDGFRAHDGFDVRINHHDEFSLSINPKTKFIEDKTLYDWIREIGIEVAEDRFSGQNFFFMRDWFPVVRLVAISRSDTISDNTIPDENEGKVSIIRYAKKNNFPEKAIENFDPDEPIVTVQFPWRDSPSSVAPSMLRGTLDELTQAMSEYSVKDASERWGMIQEFAQSISYINIGNMRANVNDDPRSNSVAAFDYPRLQFGTNGDDILALDHRFPQGRKPVTRENWGRAKSEFLKSFGPARKPRGSPALALFHHGDLKGDAVTAYDEVCHYFSEYLGIPLEADPGSIAYNDRTRLEEWIDRYGDGKSGALAYLSEFTDEYFDIIKAFQGKPIQQITHQTYRDARNSGRFSESLYNVAMGLAVKLDTRPFLLDRSLSADAVIGLSVTGDEQNTATAVMIAGETGNLVWQTETRRGTGQRTVAPEQVAKEILEEALKTAENHDEIAPLDSVIVHRSGTFGREEESAMKEVTEVFSRDNGWEKLDWCVLEVSDTDHYRIFNDSRESYLCDTGSFARLDDETITVATWADPLIRQGTPKNIRCEIEASNADFDIVELGRDVFELSYLNWGAPQVKIKEPITTYLPSRMHDIFEHCPRLQYPPF